MLLWLLTFEAESLSVVHLLWNSQLPGPSLQSVCRRGLATLPRNLFFFPEFLPLSPPYITVFILLPAPGKWSSNVKKHFKTVWAHRGINTCGTCIVRYVEIKSRCEHSPFTVFHFRDYYLMKSSQFFYKSLVHFH